MSAQLDLFDVRPIPVNRDQRPDRLARRRESARRWRRTKLGKLKSQKNAQRWKEKNGWKVRVQKRIYRAIRDGRIERQPCMICGRFPAQAHHENYLRPFDITWLCNQHHIDRHHRKEVAA